MFFEVYDTDSPVGDLWPLNIYFEVRNMIADSSKSNTLQNVYNIRSTTRNVAILKRKIYYVKTKVIALIINFRRKIPFATERCKSKKGASVSEVLALFNCSSDG